MRTRTFDHNGNPVPHDPDAEQGRVTNGDRVVSIDPRAQRSHGITRVDRVDRDAWSPAPGTSARAAELARAGVEVSERDAFGDRF